MTLETELEGVQRLGLDTAPLIYFIESHPKYGSLVRIVFERAEAGEVVVFDVDIKVAERAAELRARYRLKTPDAIQITIAIQAGCEVFLTNDKNHKRVQEVRVLFLGDFLDLHQSP